MTFGLSAAVLADLQAVFKRFSQIESVLVFGSRASAHFKDGSDIDLAIVAADMDAQTFAQLWCALDDVPMVFKLDVVHWNQLQNTALKDKILLEGVRLV